MTTSNLPRAAHLLPPRCAPLLLATALVAGCATQGARETLPPVTGSPAQHQQQREAALASTPTWGLAGRVAVSNGRDGGSGRIDWSQQDAATYTVALSAPVTRQSWRLIAEPGLARLEGLEGGTREGPDAAGLVLEATRWQIPVQALSAWIRGLPADQSTFGPVDLKFGEDGRLSRLVQDGWTVDYADWRTGDGAQVELPHRLNATRGEAKVRLIVDRWQ